MIVLALVAFAVAFTVAVARRLPGARWVYRSPRLGIAAWYTVLATGPVVAGAVVAEVLLPWHGDPDALYGGIVDERHGLLGWSAARFVTSAAVLVVAAAVLHAIRGAGAIARDRRRHREILRLAGHRSGGPGVTVIEDPRPAAYLAPGRPRRVVVTSGAVHRLHADELAAVVAHERAHATGRHQILLDIAHIAARTLPHWPLTSTAASQIGRLVEMRADEVAARTHPPLHLARAIVAMAAAPTGLLSAAGGDTVERLHRLMRPPERLSRAGNAAITASIPLLPVVPLALAALCRWWPGLSACLWDL